MSWLNQKTNIHLLTNQELLDELFTIVRSIDQDDARPSMVRRYWDIIGTELLSRCPSDG